MIAEPHDLHGYSWRLNTICDRFTDISGFSVHRWGRDGYCIMPVVDGRVRGNDKVQLTMLDALAQLDDDNRRNGVAARGAISVHPERTEKVVFGYYSLQDLEDTIASAESATWREPARRF